MSEYLQFTINFKHYEFGPFDTPGIADAWAKDQGFVNFTIGSIVKPSRAKEWLDMRKKLYGE
jgi:hypothetical protein